MHYVYGFCSVSCRLLLRNTGEVTNIPEHLKPYSAFWGTLLHSHWWTQVVSKQRRGDCDVLAAVQCGPSTSTRRNFRTSQTRVWRILRHDGLYLFQSAQHSIQGGQANHVRVCEMLQILPDFYVHGRWRRHHRRCADLPTYLTVVFFFYIILVRINFMYHFCVYQTFVLRFSIARIIFSEINQPSAIKKKVCPSQHVLKKHDKPKVHLH